MVSGGITKDCMSKSKVDPCGVRSLRVVVVNFIKHQNRAITGERVAARAAPLFSFIHLPHCTHKTESVKTDSVLCVQCGKWIHGRCAGVKRVTQLSINFTC